MGAASWQQQAAWSFKATLTETYGLSMPGRENPAGNSRPTLAPPLRPLLRTNWTANSTSPWHRAAPHRRKADWEARSRPETWCGHSNWGAGCSRRLHHRCRRLCRRSKDVEWLSGRARSSLISRNETKTPSDRLACESTITRPSSRARSEEHTSELQSLRHL